MHLDSCYKTRFSQWLTNAQAHRVDSRKGKSSRPENKEDIADVTVLDVTRHIFFCESVIRFCTVADCSFTPFSLQNVKETR